MYIREIKRTEKNQAMKLVLDTFWEFDAPDYSDKGIETFKEFVSSRNIMNTVSIYGAFMKEKIVGVIAASNNKSHISLFFVDKDYQHEGIGKKLFEYIKQMCTADIITVNSAPYAVEVYHHLGFIDIEDEKLTNGIRYTPMQYILSK